MGYSYGAFRLGSSIGSHVRSNTILSEAVSQPGLLPLVDTAETFAKTFKENVISLCKAAQLELSDFELKLLDEWITASPLKQH